MDFDTLRAAARDAVEPTTWSFYQGTADGRADPEVDTRAWDRWSLIPRMLTGIRSVDTSIELGGHRFASPLTIAATAGQGAAHEDAEPATIAAAGVAGIHMTYSNNATVDIETFGAAAASPWWAQIYVMQDAVATDDYAARAAAAGASALVLTLDIPGTLAEASFRQNEFTGRLALRGNLHPSTLPKESVLLPEHFAHLAEASGLPVWAKGILHPDDAVRAVEAGAAGIIVSNHGRRQLAGVIPTSVVLPEIAAAVGGRVPLIVDGGIRSGADVVRALALGATAAGIGRPVLWALAAGGRDAVASMLATLNEEIRVAMAALGASRVEEITAASVRRTDF